MLFDLRWHGVMCVHCPVECEERMGSDRSVPRRPGRLHSQPRDSDDSSSAAGATLVLFLAAGGSSRCFCLCVSVCLQMAHFSVSLLWQCSAGQRGWVCSFQQSQRDTRRLCTLKHIQAWNGHCELLHSGPGLFNRKPQRFLFTFERLSFTGFCHVAFRDLGIVVSTYLF